MSILFVNGSPNKNGKTASLAARLTAGHSMDTLSLVDYRINCYGQNLPGDQFDEVVGIMRQADTVILGTPIYWHNICGSLRNLLDRFYGPVQPKSFAGKKLFFICQGGAPEKWMLEACEYSINRFAGLYGFEYCGMVETAEDADRLSSTL